jgi:hypothetical protein
MKEKQVTRKVAYWIKNNFDARHCLGYLLAAKDMGVINKEKYNSLCAKIIGE